MISYGVIRATWINQERNQFQIKPQACEMQLQNTSSAAQVILDGNSDSCGYHNASELISPLKLRAGPVSLASVTWPGQCLSGLQRGCWPGRFGHGRSAGEHYSQVWSSRVWHLWQRWRGMHGKPPQSDHLPPTSSEKTPCTYYSVHEQNKVGHLKQGVNPVFAYHPNVWTYTTSPLAQETSTPKQALSRRLEC